METFSWVFGIAGAVVLLFVDGVVGAIMMGTALITLALLS